MANTPVPIPQDMRDLLIRLDQRVDDGFKNMNDKLDAINRRADNLDGRVRDLETWRSEMNGGVRGIGMGWKALLTLGGLIGGAAGVLGIQAVQPHKQVMKSDQVADRSLIDAGKP